MKPFCFLRIIWIVIGIFLYSIISIWDVIRFFVFCSNYLCSASTIFYYVRTILELCEVFLDFVRIIFCFCRNYFGLYLNLLYSTRSIWGVLRIYLYFSCLRRKARIINHRKFLQPCKKLDLNPHSMGPRVKIYSTAQHRAGLIFINHGLDDLKQRINIIFLQINIIRQQQNNTLSPEDFTTVGNIHDEDFKFVFSITRKVHIDKLEKLKFDSFLLGIHTLQHIHTSPSPAVINLSQQSFNQKKLVILSKGWKFSIPSLRNTYQ